MSQLSTVAIHRYKRSLKAWMGFVEDKLWADEFNVSAVTALGWLITDDHHGYMDDFLCRYPKTERDRRRPQVRWVVLHWLADFASEGKDG
jgi:hypothetical protein